MFSQMENWLHRRNADEVFVVNFFCVTFVTSYPSSIERQRKPYFIWKSKILLFKYLLS